MLSKGCPPFLLQVCTFRRLIRHFSAVCCVAKRRDDVIGYGFELAAGMGTVVDVVHVFPELSSATSVRPTITA